MGGLRCQGRKSRTPPKALRRVRRGVDAKRIGWIHWEVKAKRDEPLCAEEFHEDSEFYLPGDWEEARDEVVLTLRVAGEGKSRMRLLGTCGSVRGRGRPKGRSLLRPRH